ncbi:HGGxSTG domain-containing protein [Sphingomonas sp. 179-I 2A4 NHS]|uniref:HGGxSTG domain-containing protein n=1 Tax=unclassified Sphingomonas TaxID=196159 RepID=UPI00387A5F5E
MKRACGARNRSDGPCALSPMANGRCRFHGGKSTGAPKGNRNAWKHGMHSAEAIQERRRLRALLRDARLLRDLQQF